MSPSLLHQARYSLEWKPPKEASPMIKFLMRVRDDLVMKLGSLMEVRGALGKAMKMDGG